MKKLFWPIKNFQVFIILSFLFCINIYSQPYYFYSELISPNYNNIYRVNLSNGQNELFLSNIINPLEFTYDNYQKWFFIYNKMGIQIFSTDNPVCIDTIITNEQEIGVLVYLINSKNLLFLSTLKGELNDWTFETTLLNSENLSEIRKNKIPLTELSFSSKADNFLYQYDSDSISGNYFSKYSIELDSIIDKKYFYELNNNESLFFDDGKKGMVLLSYNETEYSNTPRYFVYDIDNDLYFLGISFHYRSHGYLSPNSDFVILQKALWAPEKPHAEFINGEISIYKATSGALVRNLVLPKDGKILLFDSYPDKIFYYVPETLQAITIDLSKFENEFVLSSINPSTVTINEGPFAMEIKGTGFDSLAVVYINGQPKTTTFVSDSLLTAEILSSDVAVVGSFPVWVKDRYSISDTLQFSVTQASNPNLLVNLKNSLGNQIPASNVTYYDNGWKDAVNNGDGTFTVITTKPTVSIRVYYEYASLQADNVNAQNNTYTFQTVNVAVQLKNSLGNLIDVGTVQYYAGAWRSFGTTSNGVAYKELLPINYSFRMTYEYGSIDKQQNLSVDPTVVFQTVNAAVQLKNSLGNLIDQGTVQYYAGAWRSFGTTSNGAAYKELLPINYSFRMTYEFVSKDKQQNLNTNSVVDFNTVLCSVKVSKTSNNQPPVAMPINNATVKYYAGAWRNLGTTNSSGIATKELLPANLSFRATFGNVSQDKQQDISVNSLVEILLNIP